MATKKVLSKLESISEVGIESVNPIVRFLARTINRVVRIDEDQDGDVEGGEILKTVQNVGFDAFATFRGFSWPEFKLQTSDVDAVERQQLVEAFAQEFDLPNDQAEYLIEDYLEWLNRGSVLIERTRKLTQKAA